MVDELRGKAKVSPKESVRNVSRSREKGQTGERQWKVDCCMLEHRKHVAVIYTLFYRNFSHS